MEVFAYAGTVSPDLAARVEAEMTDLEVAAVATAKPTPYVHDVLAACRESGRTVAVVSNNAERAVQLYLTRHGLDDRIGPVFARTSHDPALLKPSPHLIDKAVQALNADPAATALVGDSITDIEGSRLRGHRQHRLRQQARQVRAHDRRRSRSRHHHPGRPRPQTPRTPCAVVPVTTSCKEGFSRGFFRPNSRLPEGQIPTLTRRFTRIFAHHGARRRRRRVADLRER